MIYWLRWLVRFLLIALVAFFERVVSLPVLTLILTALYATRLNGAWRWGLLLLVSWLTAALFMVPLSMVWLVINLNYLVVNHTQKILPSRIFRLTISGLVGATWLVVLGFGQINLNQFIYGLAAIFACIVWLKRHRFYLK